MPFTLTKLTPEEIQTRFVKPERKVDLTPYLDQLRGLKVGEGGQIEFQDDASRKAHVGRFNKAAKDLGVKLKWSYPDNPSDRRVFVQVVAPDPDTVTAPPSGENAAPANTSPASPESSASENGSSRPRQRQEPAAKREPVAA